MKAAFWLSALASADRVLGRLETTFIGAALAFSSGLLFVNVILRYVFLAPIAGVEEVSLYLLVWIVFVGSSVAMRTRGHVAIDLVPRTLPTVQRRRLALLVSALVLIFLAVFFYYSLAHTLSVKASGQLTPITQAPMWITYLAMPVGSALMFLRTSQFLWGIIHGDPDAERRLITELQD
jgi:C4-dicarboxylate transporter, DctQ subunit